jgi:hypothetical protein
LSDWEGIFGAGVSAESVIAGINASSRAESVAEEQRQRLEKILDCRSFKGDSAIKAEFIAGVNGLLGQLIIEPALFNPLNAAALFPASFDEIEVRYNVPSLLLHLIEHVLQGLAHDDYARNAQLGQSRTLDWLRLCLSSIPVGADLTLVGYKFVGQCVRVVEEGQSQRMAADIAYARARGVFAPANLCKVAQRRAWKCDAEPFFDEWAPTEDELLGQRVCASAAALDPAEIAETLKYLIFWADRESIFGQVGTGSVCEKYGEQLVQYVTAAPKYRLRVIDFDAYGE